MLALVILFFTACGRSAPEGPDTFPEGGVIAFGPSLTETVYALGHGERLVGVSSFVTYPPEAIELPFVGGMTDPNLERIAALQPRLVLLAGRVPLIEQLGARSGFAVRDATMDTLAQIESGTQTIAQLLGDGAAGERLWAEIAAELRAVEQEAAERPRVSVFIAMSRSRGDLNQLFTMGGTSFVHELVALAGGDNIFADASQPYLEASKERVLARAPEVIIELQPGAMLDDEARARMRAEWKAMPTLPAVQSGRIHILTEDYLLIPGPRIGQTARRLFEAIHAGGDTD